MKIQFYRLCLGLFISVLSPLLFAAPWGTNDPGASHGNNGRKHYAPDTRPVDRHANTDTKAVLAYLAAVSRGTVSGVIAGQQIGHGDQVWNPSGLFGYEPMIGQLEQQTSEAPGIAGLDYEHDQIYTLDQLNSAKWVLLSYWNNGGLITINWSPHNPWWNDESDIAGNHGDWTGSRVMGGDMSVVVLRDLLNPNKAIHQVWRRKLDRVAAALLELQAAGVVVLWRPMQEMNGSWFWWGSSTTASGEDYKALWRDMFKYFTKEKGLHNLLWVYSPIAPWPDHKSLDWAYPGAEYVDIIAPTSYQDDLSIRHYDEYSCFGKVLGVAEYGPAIGGPYASTGTFDNTAYVRKLADSPFAYWVSWSDWMNGETPNYESIIHNANAAALMQDPATITRRKINWQAYRRP